MNNLADDLLHRIFMYCEVKDIVYHFRRISKHIHTALCYQPFWKQVYLHYYGHHSHNYDHIHESHLGIVQKRSWMQWVIKCMYSSECMSEGKYQTAAILEHSSIRAPYNCIRMVHSFVESDKMISEQHSANYLIAGTADYKLCIWRKKLFGKHSEWKLAHVNRGHYGSVNNVEVSKTSWSGDFLPIYTSALDGSVSCWSLTNLGEDNELLTHGRSMHEHKEKVKCLHASHTDAERLITCAADKFTKFWDITVGKSIQSIKTNQMVWCIEEGGRDGLYTQVLAGDTHGHINILSANHCSKPTCFKAHSDIVSQIAYIPEDNIIISTSFDKSIKIWDIRKLDSQSPLLSIPDAHLHNILSLSRKNKNSSQFATCSADGWARIWDYKTGQLVRTLISTRALFHSSNEAQNMHQPLSFGNFSVKMHHGGVISNLNATNDITLWTERVSSDDKTVKAIPTSNLKLHSILETVQSRTVLHDFLVNSNCIVASAHTIPDSPNLFSFSRSFLQVWEFDE